MLVEPTEPRAEGGTLEELKASGDRFHPHGLASGVLELAKLPEEGASPRAVGKPGQFGKPPRGEGFAGEKQGCLESGEFLRANVLPGWESWLNPLR